MSAAGQQLVAGRVPGERIATAIRTTSTGTFTSTETQSDTVTAALINGRTYKIAWWGLPTSSVAGDAALIRVREDNLTGTLLQAGRVHIGAATGFAAYFEVHYTAAATGDKTFIVSGQRSSGTGNISLAAASTQPSHLYVDYISG